MMGSAERRENMLGRNGTHTQESVGWYKMENKVETEDYKTVVRHLMIYRKKLS